MCKEEEAQKPQPITDLTEHLERLNRDWLNSYSDATGEYEVDQEALWAVVGDLITLLTTLLSR